MSFAKTPSPRGLSWEVTKPTAKSTDEVSPQMSASYPAPFAQTVVQRADERIRSRRLAADGVRESGGME